MLASDVSLDDKIDRFVDSYHTLLTRHPYLLAFALTESMRRPDVVQDFYSGERRQAARRMVGKLRRQINEHVNAHKGAPVSAEQFFVTLAGSCMFPFVARPMLATVLGLQPIEIKRFMEERRTHLPAFLKRALRQ